MPLTPTADPGRHHFEDENIYFYMDNGGERESWSRKSVQDDKWSFCLTAGTLWPANQERQ